MIDFLLDENFDLMIANGDFVMGDATEQNQALLLLAQKGEVRQFPDAGCGSQDWLDDDEVSDLGAEIQKQLELDGMKVKKIEVFESGKINIDAHYEE